MDQRTLQVNLAIGRSGDRYTVHVTIALKMGIIHKVVVRRVKFVKSLDIIISLFKQRECIIYFLIVINHILPISCNLYHII